MVSTRIAAFGIGSTNFRYAAGTVADGFETEIYTEPTDAAALTSHVLTAIERLEREIDGELDAVSIAVTGLVDSTTGTITELDTATGSQLTDIRLAATIENRFGLPTIVENDCTASVIGEYVFGDGGGYRCVLHVTLGTGIGGGLLENGQVLRGEDGYAAEVGLIPVQATGDLESFGVRGAWEAYCSGRGIPDFVRTLLATEERETSLSATDELCAKDVFAAAERGDQVAVSYLDRIGRLNAAGVGALVNTYNPGLVTLGGGVTLNNQAAVLSGIRAYLEEYVYVPMPEIGVTQLGDYIGLYGALGAFATEVDAAVPTATVRD